MGQNILNGKKLDVEPEGSHVTIADKNWVLISKITITFE